MSLQRFAPRLLSALTFFAALNVSVYGQQTANKPIRLTSAVTILESVQQPGPVHRATQDLAVRGSSDVRAVPNIRRKRAAGKSCS